MVTNGGCRLVAIPTTPAVSLTSLVLSFHRQVTALSRSKSRGWGVLGRRRTGGVHGAAMAYEVLVGVFLRKDEDFGWLGVRQGVPTCINMPTSKHAMQLKQLAIFHPMSRCS